MRYQLYMRLRNADDRIQVTLLQQKKNGWNSSIDVAAETWEPKYRPLIISNAKAELILKSPLTQRVQINPVPQYSIRLFVV